MSEDEAMRYEVVLGLITKLFFYKHSTSNYSVNITLFQLNTRLCRVLVVTQPSVCTKLLGIKFIHIQMFCNKYNNIMNVCGMCSSESLNLLFFHLYCIFSLSRGILI